MKTKDLVRLIGNAFDAAFTHWLVPSKTWSWTSIDKRTMRVDYDGAYGKRAFLIRVKEIQP